jgi:peroxiredoxin
MKHFLYSVLFCCSVLSNFAQAKLNQAAPEFSLPSPDSKMIGLSDLKGKVVLIDFWASWCEPCRENNPHLVKLYKKFHADGFEILGVSLDTNEASWKQAIVQDNLQWNQVNDNKGWSGPSTVSYNVEAIPSMILIDKKGIIREINLIGWRLEDRIKSLLKSK